MHLQYFPKCIQVEQLMSFELLFGNKSLFATINILVADVIKLCGVYYIMHHIYIFNSFSTYQYFHFWSSSNRNLLFQGSTHYLTIYWLALNLCVIFHIVLGLLILIKLGCKQKIKTSLSFSVHKGIWDKILYKCFIFFSHILFACSLIKNMKQFLKSRHFLVLLLLRFKLGSYEHLFC